MLQMIQMIQMLQMNQMLQKNQMNRMIQIKEREEYLVKVFMEQIIGQEFFIMEK
jgi:hypothetical protein